MRALTLIALAMVVGCGAPPTDDCPGGESLLTWVWPVGSVQFSGCNRSAELTTTPNVYGPSIGSSYQTTAKMVTLSARFELLSGTGRLRVSVGDQASERRDSGPLSVTGPVVEGFTRLSLHALPETEPVRWRVSDVRIE